MKAIGHISITILTLYAFRIDAPEIVVPALVGSVLPDCDHKKSWVGKLIFLHKFFKHRKQVHSIFFALLFAFLSLSLGRGYIISLSIFFGYALHLLTDRFTSNVSFLFWYPLKRKSVKTKLRKNKKQS